MDKLTAKAACAGLLPLSIGDVTLTEEPQSVLTVLTSRKGRATDAATALEISHGVKWPKPGRANFGSRISAIWFGHDEVLIKGEAPDKHLKKECFLVDQSDAWAVVRMEGDQCEDVLARLVPMDLRPAAFSRGQTARTQLFHISVSITRLPDDAFLILAFRSMAASLVHDLKTAMEAVAARG
ncbi:sarcosine oxidase subunit gamma [Lutimaribacter marinistellae]|uniref:Sarcosine oxidase subunit gamma n=1 Tax=Lutimaribacter marinistellae TaxID=1820329 RepID=A0ABV7TNM1_9RHOB